jgi:hypothetical protein
LRESNVCAWLFRVLTASRNQVVSDVIFRNNRREDQKVSSNECRRLICFVKTVSRQPQALNKFEGLLFESIAAAYVSVTVGRAEKFAPACAL